MIDLDTWDTPSGRKVRIMLEECGLPERIRPVDLGAGEQLVPELLALSPNAEILAIIDSDGPENEPISLFESGEIPLSVSDKTGRFVPSDQYRRWINDVAARSASARGLASTPRGLSGQTS
jgi:GST-like protein